MTAIAVQSTLSYSRTMESLWNDLQALERLRFKIDVLASIIAVLAAVLVVGSRWPLARRIAELQAIKSDALVQRVQTAESVAEAAQKKLVSLTVEVSLVVVGDWSAPLVPNGFQPLTLPQDGPVVVLKGEGASREAKFFVTYVKRFNHDDGTASVKFRGAVRDGEWPLGESIDILKGLRPTTVALPLFSAGDTKTGEATVQRMDFSLFSNGHRSYHFEEAALNGRAILPASGWLLADTTLPAIE